MHKSAYNDTAHVQYTLSYIKWQGENKSLAGVVNEEQCYDGIEEH